MQRVAVVGCGGSGKTTLANELGARLGLPVIHIDSHYWRWVEGKRVEATAEEWTDRHRYLIADDAWVIEGMKFGVLDERLDRADTVVYLDLPTSSCISGIMLRWIRYLGRDHPERGIYTSINWEFLRWVWSFRRKQRQLLLDKLRNFSGKTIVLRRRGDVRRFLDTGIRGSARNTAIRH
jgi:adenylate kinase family enzyme